MSHAVQGPNEHLENVPVVTAQPVASSPIKPKLPSPEDLDFAAPEPEPEAPQVAETTPASAAPPDPPKHAHPKSLVRMASELGIGIDEIAETPTADLHELVRSQAAFTQARSNRAPAAARPAQPAPVDPLADHDWGEIVGEDGVARKATEADVHPGLVSAIRKLAKENQELKATVGTVAQTQEQRRQSAVTARVDKKFAEYEHILGKGSHADLDPNGPDMARRNAVASAVRADPSNNSLEHKIDRAVKLLFGNAAQAKPKAAAKQQAAQTQLEEAFTTGGVAKPTNRIGAQEPKGLARAKKAFANGMASLERTESDGDDDAF